VPRTFNVTVTPVIVPLVVTPNILVENNGYWLLVQGSNFTPASVVLGNGKPLRTQFVSSTLLLAYVPRFTLIRVGRHRVIRVLTLREGQRFVVDVRSPGMPALGPVRLPIVEQVFGRDIPSRRLRRLGELYEQLFGRDVDALFLLWLKLGQPHP
jgi:hypothetical protein